MTDKIPAEVRAQIEQFKATDPGWQQSRNSSVEKRIIIPKRGTTSDAERLATLQGFIVTGGGGKHGKHVETNDGKFVCSLPDHGGSGNLATGTWNSILKALGLK